MVTQNRIKTIPRTESPYERAIDDNTRATAARVKAVQDYNIMMGILDDPTEEGENDE